MKSSLIVVDEEDTLNQTWAKSKCLDTNVNLDKTWLPEMKDEVDEEDTLNKTWAKSKSLDTNVNLDKTWLPDMKDEDLE